MTSYVPISSKIELSDATNGDGVVKKNHEDICVSDSNHCVIVCEGGVVMEVQHHSRVSLFLVAVNLWGAHTYGISSGTRHPRRSALP